MKNRHIPFLYILSAALLLSGQTSLFAGSNASALTLNECFGLALKQSENIAISREKIQEAEARFTQALGTILPHISFSRSDYLEDTNHLSSYKKHTYDQKFVFKQTLFSGFKEFAGMSGSKSEVKQRKLESKRATHLLFVDVADAFYLLMELRKDIEALIITRKALADRINDLKERIDVGKSRSSELSSTEVQLYTADAELSTVKSQETLARDLLEFLIGRPAGEITDDGAPLIVENEATYIRDSSLRPDVEASRFAWEADKKRAYIAKTGFLPSVDIESGYYTHKTSAPQNGKWDALLSVSVPIFEGTETIGQVQESKSVARQSELAYKRAARLAIQDIHDSYSLVTTAGARTEALTKALASAEENSKLQQEDYKLNLVSNLDVLSAIQTLQDTRRTYNSAYYENRRYYWQLRAASGSIPQAE
jgi:outer membrane protein